MLFSPIWAKSFCCIFFKLLWWKEILLRGEMLIFFYMHFKTLEMRHGWMVEHLSSVFHVQHYMDRWVNLSSGHYSSSLHPRTRLPFRPHQLSLRPRRSWMRVHLWSNFIIKKFVLSLSVPGPKTLQPKSMCMWTFQVCVSRACIVYTQAVLFLCLHRLYTGWAVPVPAQGTHRLDCPLVCTGHTWAGLSPCLHEAHVVCLILDHLSFYPVTFLWILTSIIWFSVEMRTTYCSSFFIFFCLTLFSYRQLLL